MIVKSIKEIVAFAQAEVPDKRFAFGASYRQAGLWGLSLVIMDEVGHNKLPDRYAVGTEAEMHDVADLCNSELGVTKTQASIYIGESMRGARRSA